MVSLRAIGGKSPIFDYFLPFAPGGNGKNLWLGQGIEVMLKVVIHKEFLVAPRCWSSTVLPQQAVGLPHFSCSGSQAGACRCWQIPVEYDRGWVTKQTPNYWPEFLPYIINALQFWDLGLDDVETPKTHCFLWRKVFFFTWEEKKQLQSVLHKDKHFNFQRHALIIN